MVSYWIQGATLAALMVITALAARDSKGSHSFHRTVWFPEGEFKKRGQKLPSSEEYDYDLDQQNCLDVPQIEAIKERFERFLDMNKDGVADGTEIAEYLQKYNPQIQSMKVKAFIARRDKNGNGKIDLIPDYLLQLSQPDYSRESAKEWFSLEDSNHDGYVSKEELLKIGMRIGLSPQEAKETAFGYYMSEDMNNDGKLTWNEYKKLFKQ